MKLNLLVLTVICLCFSLLSYTPAHAAGDTPDDALPPDGILRTLSPNSIAWYQFEYIGDKTQIHIRLLDGGVSNIASTINHSGALA